MNPWAAGPKQEACVEYVREAVRVKDKVNNWVDNVWEDALLQIVGHINNKAVSNLRTPHYVSKLAEASLMHET
jgi:hypothetical protein